MISLDHGGADSLAPSTEQTANLERVRRSIEFCVVEFLNDLKRRHASSYEISRLSPWPQFTGVDLERYVTYHVKASGGKDGLSPGSAMRILRKLREDDLVAFTVVNRPGSVYMLDWCVSIHDYLAMKQERYQ